MTDEEKAAAAAEKEASDTLENGNATDAPVTSSDTEDVEALKTKLAAAEKEAEKAKMERNMRRKEAEEAKVKALEETERYKEANEELKKQIEQREAEEAEAAETKQVEELRGQIISEFPKEVQEIAKDLNLYWDATATNTAEADTQLRAKLTAIQSRLGETDDDGNFTPRINANNPAPDEGTDGKRFEDMTSDEMRKVLPIAPPR